jgi:hypothetical protein
MAAGAHRVAGRAPGRAPELIEQSWTCRAVDRAVHAAAAAQRLVGSVDDRVDREGGDVGLDDLDGHDV